MDMKDVCGACGDILEEVADAIERNDYSDLNNKINYTVNKAVGQIKVNIKSNTRNYGQRNYTYKTKEYTYDTKRNKAVKSENSYTYKANQDTDRNEVVKVKRNEIISDNPFGMVVGIFQLIFGIILSSGFGMFALLFFIMLLLGDLEFAIPCLVLTAFTIVSSTGIVKGSRKLKLLKRFKKYTRLIGPRDYIEVRELSQSTGYKKENVIKDIQKLINNNMFPQGRLDKTNTTLMLTDDIYQQYIESEKWQTQQKLREKFQKAEEAKAYKEEPSKQEQQKQEAPKQVYEESVQKILDSGEEYIRIVHKCNDDIPDEEMSDKLYKLENIMSRIFEQVKRDPDSADDLHKLMDYYLPTTIKLLNAYIDLDRQEIDGENISKTKREIEEVMDTINLAFEKLLDSMFEETAWDISSDISVMKTMLQQEGLTDNKDFK